MILPLLLAVMIQVSHCYLCSAPYPQEYRVPSRTRYLVTPATYSSMCLIGSAALGMISDSIYTLGEVNSGTSFLRKIDKNDQELWIKMYNINPAEATLSIARDESFLLYTQNSHFPLILLDTNTGNLLKSYDNASILCDVRFTIIVVASDNSGVYFNQVNSIASFCRFMFSTSTADCFRFTGCTTTSGLTLINDSTIIMTYLNTNLPKRLMIHRILISSTSISTDWIMQTSNINGGSMDKCSNIFDSNANIVYSSNCFDNKFLFFKFNANTGSTIGNRFINNFSTTSCGKTETSVKQSNKIYTVPILDSTQYVYVFDISSDSFTGYFKILTTQYAYSFIAKSYVLYLFGYKTPSFTLCDMSKVGENLISFPDFATTTNITRTLAPTEYQIVASLTPASTLTSYSTTLSTISPSEISSVLISISTAPDTFSSDVIYYLDSYTNLNIGELKTLSLPIDLTCSIDGSTAITYSFIQIGANQIPNWITLNTISSKLELTTPDVNSNTNFTFGVQATVNGYNYVKTILLQVIDSNTQQNSSSNSTNLPSSSNPQIINVLSYCAISASAIVGILGLVLTLTNNSSTSMIWSLVNLYQMLLLLPLIGAFMHTYVVDFIKGVQFSVLTFSLPQNKQQSVQEELSYFECVQDNQYLNDIGIEYCSTLMNISSSIMVDLLIVMIHLSCLFLYLCLRNSQSCIVKFFVWLLKILSFSAYIRKFIESFLFLSISCTQELHNGRIKSTPEIISFIFSLSVLIFLCLSSIFLVACHPKSMHNDFNIRRFWVKEFYEGFKMNHSGKVYFFVFTSRRIILTSWIFFGDLLSKTLRICLFCVLQFPSLPYVAIFRPYSETKENICETLNEIIYSLLCLFLCFINEENQWTALMAYLIIWIITISSFTIMIIMLICAVKFLIFSPKSPLRCSKKIAQSSVQRVAHKPTVNKTSINQLSNVSSQNINIEESKICEDKHEIVPIGIQRKRKIYLRD